MSERQTTLIGAATSANKRVCVISCVMFLIQTFGHKNGSRKFNPLGVLIMEFEGWND